VEAVRGHRIRRGTPKREVWAETEYHRSEGRRYSPDTVKDPRKTSLEISREAGDLGIHMAPSSVRERLQEKERRARRAVKKQLLTRAMKLKRLPWVRQHKSWTAEDWSKVLFSDETHFVVQGFRSSFVRRSKGEPLRPSHIIQSTKFPPRRCFGVVSPSVAPEHFALLRE
jgi:hypothetical protein